MQVVTLQPLVDERNNHRVAIRNETITPVYRANRNYNDPAKRISAKRNSSQSQNSSESQLVNVDKTLKKDNKQTSSAENSRRHTSSAEYNSRAISAENIAERKHRRRMTLKHNNATTAITTIEPLTTITSIESTTPAVEIVKQEIQRVHHDNLQVRQEKLTDQLESADSINPTILKDAEGSPAVKRFYRSSAESDKEDQEMTLVNNEKVQIVRPTSMVKLVGQHATPTATIAKLDEAILGTIPKKRVKKEVVTIVTPQRDENPRQSTNRFRT